MNDRAGAGKRFKIVDGAKAKCRSPQRGPAKSKLPSIEPLNSKRGTMPAGAPRREILGLSFKDENGGYLHTEALRVEMGSDWAHDNREVDFLNPETDV